MSYHEENDQVVLTMSRDDYERLMISLGRAAGSIVRTAPDISAEAVKGRLLSHFAFVDRLNEGNPHYTPYTLEAKKA